MNPDDKSDLDLVYNLKNNIEIKSSLNELINRHSGIFYDVLNQHSNPQSHNQQREEIISDMELLFYNTCKKYDVERGTKFSTFLGNETRWHCLNSYNKNKKYFLPDKDFLNFYLKEDQSDVEFSICLLYTSPSPRD